MLPKSKRLTRRDIESLGGRGGRKVHTEHFSLIAQPHAREKWGVVVSKKVARKAVARNLLRRRLYALAREVGSPYPAPHSLLIITKKGAAEGSFQELRTEFMQLCERARSD